ncbi:MAG TPA: pyruvate dehydrogenase (acetyl-transferring) E1 component subunit alpha [Chloroflexota bacterium]|nr:pyruvate dehydrogenase (acetyl-transferring) E1 component subunit alpha [Chloroflexota bacterium]
MKLHSRPRHADHFPGAEAFSASLASLAQPLEPFRVLAPDGTVCGPLPKLSEEQLQELYRWMVFGQHLDQRALQLQRQGRIGVWGPTRGQEAIQVGLGLAMEAEDWIFPSYREVVTLCMRGLDLGDLLNYYRGLYWLADPKRTGVYPQQICIGDQTLHAVGAGMAFRLQKRAAVAVAVIGDGATSEGDFHEALNFGGVFCAQAVVLIQNNHWAISRHWTEQTASASLAEKAMAHGIPGVLVDGNDPLAVYTVTRWALDRARSGQGPTLIEGLTYRLGAHTTADDPNRYVPPDELNAWRALDPLIRMRRFLEDRGLWDDTAETGARQEALARVDEAMQRAEQTPMPPAERLFETTLATPTRQLLAQRDELLTDT